MDFKQFIKTYPDLAKSKRWTTFLRDKGCVYCLLPIDLITLTEDNILAAFGFRDDQFILMTIDHIHPKSKNGKNIISNLQTLCQPCNNRKSDGLDIN